MERHFYDNAGNIKVLYKLFSENFKELYKEEKDKEQFLKNFMMSFNTEVNTLVKEVQKEEAERKYKEESKRINEKENAKKEFLDLANRIIGQDLTENFLNALDEELNKNYKCKKHKVEVKENKDNIEKSFKDFVRAFLG